MAGDDKKQLFLAVLERHKGIIYKIANSYRKDSEDRKDLVQEIIIQLWRSFDRYNSNYKHSTWIYRIALNTAISFYRKETRRRFIAQPLTEESLKLETVFSPIDVETNLNILEQFIQGLKEMDKALMLLYLEENSYREIAEIMGYSETNVATKISRIKAALQQKFSLIKEQ